MHERVEAEARETPELAAVPSLREGAVVERMLALQRSAGNAAGSPTPRTCGTAKGSPAGGSPAPPR